MNPLSRTFHAGRTGQASPSARFGLAASARAARAALQWRLLLLWAGALMLPTLVLALPMWQLLGANLDHSVHAAALARELDLTAITDLLAGHGRNSMAFSNAGVAALVLTLLLSPLLAGMAVSAARASATPGFRALAGGAIDEYPRMLRMLAVAVLPFGLAAGIGGMALDLAQEHAGQAILAADAGRARAAAMLLLGLLLVLAHATLDAGRAALALDRRRRSAFLAWLDGCALLARRPLATLGAYLPISACALLLAALLGVARINVAGLGATLGGFFAVLALTQLIVMVLAWMRCARLFAMVELARQDGVPAGLH